MPLTAAAATYNFSGAVGGANFPACSGGTWSASGSTFTCSSGTIALASGDAISPATSITVIAQAGATLAGNNTIGSVGVAVDLQTAWGQLQIGSGSTVHGNLASSSGAINSTGTTVNGSITTPGTASLNGGSVSGSLTASNGVTTTNGTVIGGNVTANTGSISLSGGSVGGAVHSDCCTVTTTNTNVANGVSSNSNTVTIDGGTISGIVTTAGGGGVIIKNATITGSGQVIVVATNVAINISNSTVYGSVAGNNFVTLSNHTTVWGDVTAGNWPGALQIDGTSQVAGNCSPDHPRCGIIQMDHVRLTHTGSGVTCIGSPVTVTVCNSADSNGTCAPSTKGVSGNIVAKHGGTTVATVPFEILSGASSVVVPVAVGAPLTVTFETANLSLAGANPTTCWNSSTGTASCEHEYADAGFIVSDASNGNQVPIATQTAGIGSATYYLRAVKMNHFTKACEAALLGTNAVNLAYECVNPTTCYGANLMTVNGGTSTAIARNNEDNGGGISSWMPVNMAFDGNGSAPFTLNYTDAGRVTLHASKSLGGSYLVGASSFVTKPYGFKLTATCTGSSTVNAANQTMPSVVDPKFCPAGSAFSAVVTAVASGANDPITPNYGREEIPPGNTPETVAVTWSRHLPADTETLKFADGTLPTATLNHTGTNDVPFTGSFAATGLNWSEVGILKATIGVGDSDYLGAGDVISTAYVGRFYPHHFTVIAEGQTRPKQAAETDETPRTCSGFAYSGHPSPLILGQPFNLTVTAVNEAGKKTKNFAYSDDASNRFAKEVSLSFSSEAGSPTARFYRGTRTGADADKIAEDLFLNGTHTIKPGDVDEASFVFDSYPARSTDISIHAQDADTGNVDVAGANGNINIRTGRLRLSNAFGSEKRTLDMPVQAQYWSGLTWVINDLDHCTWLPTGTFFFAMKPLTATTSVANTPVTIGVEEETGGRGRLVLAAPGVVATADIAINLGEGGTEQSCLKTNGPTTASAAIPWLRATNGTCEPTNDRDPSARATFGVYTPENRRMVHVREMF